MRQQIQFSEREKQVIELLIQGKSNKQIALALGVSPRTVEFHLSKVYVKLEVTSRTEAVLKLGQAGLRESTGEELRESTVPETDESGDNGRVLIPSWRLLMKNKSVLVGFSLLVVTCLACVVSILLTVYERAPERVQASDTTATIAIFPVATASAEVVTPASTLATVVPGRQDMIIPPHTVNGYTAAIESYYIDASHILFQVRITGGETKFGDENFYFRFKNAEIYQDGTLVNTSGGWGPAVDPALVEFVFSPLTLLKGDRFQGEFAFDLLDAPGYEQTVARFRFELDLPIYPDTRFYPKQTVRANGLEISLDSVTVSPTFTQAYLCFPPPSYAPWTIGSQTLLQLEGQEASLHNFSLLFGSDLGGDRSAGSEPYWAPPTKNGRCIKIGFPIGSSDPTSLTLTIPELENLAPDILMTDQLSIDYPGLTPKEAYHTYMDEHGNTYKGPWIFNVDLNS